MLLKDEYSNAAEQFKEEIISDFIRQNPGIGRNEVVTKYVNGKVVCEHISQVFKEMAIRKPARTPAEKKLLNEMSKGGDERFTSGMDSIGSCRRFADWLATTPHTAFGDIEKKDTNEFLERKEHQFGTCALDLNQAKRKLAQLMKDGPKPQESMTKTLIGEYFHSFLVHLKCLHSIFTKEVDLGDQFSKFAQEYIKKNFEQFKVQAKHTTITAIKKAFAVLKGSHIVVTDIDSKEKLEAIDNALKEFKDQLEKRRGELDTIKKMIEFLDGIVGTFAAKPAAEEPKGPSGPRMVYASKMDRNKSSRR